MKYSHGKVNCHWPSRGKESVKVGNGKHRVRLQLKSLFRGNSLLQGIKKDDMTSLLDKARFHIRVFSRYVKKFRVEIVFKASYIQKEMALSTHSTRFKANLPL